MPRIKTDLDLLLDLLEATKAARAAPEILQWLLGGPLTLGEIVARRVATDRFRCPHPGECVDCGFNEHASFRSVVFDLQALDGWITYSGGRILMLATKRPGVELYDEISRGDEARAPETSERL